MTPAPRILVVDDEPQILRFLTYALQAGGYDPVPVACARDALAELEEGAFAAMVLDLGLPDMDGKAVIERIRPRLTLPIIVLSAHDQEMERIMALDLGADDFIAKPFGIGEFMARLRVCLRRGQPQTAMTVAGFAIDPATHAVTIDARHVKLTRKEFALIALLWENAGHLLRHRQLLQAVWGPAHVEDVSYLRVFIGQLRRKLALTPESAVQIETEAGIGYRLVLKSAQRGDNATL